MLDEVLDLPVVRQLDSNTLWSTGGPLTPDRMQRGLQSYEASPDNNE
jgi:hypothetical protein